MTRIGASAVLAALASAALVAQQDPIATFSSSVQLVEVYATVTDDKGELVTGLTRDDFEIYESNQIQEVSTFAAGEFPLGTRAQVEAQKTFTFTVPLLIGQGPVNVSVAVADQLAGTSGFAKTTVNTK